MIAVPSAMNTKICLQNYVKSVKLTKIAMKACVVSQEECINAKTPNSSMPQVQLLFLLDHQTEL